MGGALVIGAKNGSLGFEVARRLSKEMPTTTAGVSSEDLKLDVLDLDSVLVGLEAVKPHTIIVTAGVNLPAAVGDLKFNNQMMTSMMINAIGPMAVLDLWKRQRELFSWARFFAVVSSNSAHIARRNSAPYCSSKAALSMAIRCAARELAGKPIVMGFEPGLIRGTPMTKATERTFGPAQSRMVGAKNGLYVQDVARAVVENAARPWHGQNGALLRFDAGEQ